MNKLLSLSSGGHRFTKTILLGTSISLTQYLVLLIERIGYPIFTVYAIIAIGNFMFARKRYESKLNTAWFVGQAIPIIIFITYGVVNLRLDTSGDPLAVLSLGIPVIMTAIYMAVSLISYWLGTWRRSAG